jgi:hypothetical protein
VPVRPDFPGVPTDAGKPRDGPDHHLTGCRGLRRQDPGRPRRWVHGGVLPSAAAASELAPGDPGVAPRTRLGATDDLAHKRRPPVAKGRSGAHLGDDAARFERRCCHPLPPENQKGPRLCETPCRASRGGRIRTCDLWVMSPASYRTAPPRIMRLTTRLVERQSRPLSTGHMGTAAATRPGPVGVAVGRTPTPRRPRRRSRRRGPSTRRLPRRRCPSRPRR